MFCKICQFEPEFVQNVRIRSNVRSFSDRLFDVWRCPSCECIHCTDVCDLNEYYKDYPIRNQKLDYFLGVWFGNILKRLKENGFRRNHTLLDYGCNRGAFVQFLHEHGYKNCLGYDPYVPEFRRPELLRQKYDFVTNFDVIEHHKDPHSLFKELSDMLNPEGVLCTGTPNATGIDLSHPEDFIHAIHVPYHIHILSLKALHNMYKIGGFSDVRIYGEWYMNSWFPGTSERFILSLLKARGNCLDDAYERPSTRIFFKNPRLILEMLFGYFIPTGRKDNMMFFGVKGGK